MPPVKKHKKVAQILKLKSVGIVGTPPLLYYKGRGCKNILYDRNQIVNHYAKGR